jgi:UTP-glucose-1-phosphate uridylyltransferase
MQPAFDLVNKLSKDCGMRNEYREMAFEFYKQHQDSQYSFAEMMKQIEDNL